MPTYRNDTDQRITHAGKTYIAWQPGEAKSLPFFVPWRELGLTLTDPEPFVLRGALGRGVGYFEDVLDGGEVRTYEFPYMETFCLSVYVPRGLVKLFLGDSDVPILCDSRNNHISTYPWDMCAYITVEAVPLEESTDDLLPVEGKKSKGAEVMVKAEPFTVKGV